MLSPRVAVTPDTILKEVRMATDANISLDGKMAAFVVWEWVPDRPKQRGRIWVVDTPGGEPRPLTKGPRGDSSPRWSPDSQQLAFYFASGPDETDWFRGQIGIVGAHGGAVRQVTQLTRQACSLTWSPDGSRLAYISGEWSDLDRGGGDIYVLSLESGEVRNLTPGINFSPSWCCWFPDGRRLLYVAWDGVSSQVGI